MPTRKAVPQRRLRFASGRWAAAALAGAIGAGGAVAGPPSGRPPVGPAQRYEPRVYDITFEVAVNTFIQKVGVVEGREVLSLEDAPIVMPLIYQGAYSWIQPKSVFANLWLENSPDAGLASRFRIDDGLPFHTQLAVIPVETFRGQTLRWNVGFRGQAFSSRVDERAATQLAWPREWPAEVQDALQPQLYIESEHALFADAVADAAGSQLRMVPPYLAAKDLVRYCLNHVQLVGNGVHRGEFGVLRGLEIKGALETATSGSGSPHDVVCVCVATLRAAGIPARPVIGIDVESNGFVSWGEFYLEGAGWIPFDPSVLVGNGFRQRDVRQASNDFGTMKDLNRRMPLAYSFVPARAVQSPQYAALWGWDPRPHGAFTVEQQIRLGAVSRGRGEEDPR